MLLQWKWKKIGLAGILIAVLGMQGCGKEGSSASSTNNVSQNNPSSQTQSVSQNASCVRSSNAPISRPIQVFTKDGQGRASVLTAQIADVDQTLKALIVPNGAKQSANSGGTQSYTQMSARIGLYENGKKLVAAFQVPTQQGGTYGPNKGVPVGQRSEVVDFSSYLLPGKTYQIQVSDVMTDYMCKTACIGAGWYWGSSLSQCISLQCDVGPAQDSAVWSVQIQVETDTTPCL